MTSPNLPEKLVLTILICLSAAGFWYRFRRVVHVISAARPDPGFALGDLFPRIRSFVWEVLLQGKVIQAAPGRRIGPCFRVLGILRFCPDHRESHRHRFRRPDTLARQRIRPDLFWFRRPVRGRGGHFNRVPRSAALHPATGMAGQSLAGIGDHRRADIPPDGHLSRGPFALRTPALRAARSGGRTLWRCSSSCL